MKFTAIICMLATATMASSMANNKVAKEQVVTATLVPSREQGIFPLFKIFATELASQEKNPRKVISIFNGVIKRLLAGLPNKEKPSIGRAVQAYSVETLRKDSVDTQNRVASKWNNVFSDVAGLKDLVERAIKGDSLPRGGSELVDNFLRLFNAMGRAPMGTAKDGGKIIVSASKA